MKCEVEKITPYNNDERKGKQIEKMFDNIAPAYDFMNRAMSLGLDRLWRRKAVDMLRKRKPHRLLDIACGTGDMAMQLCVSLNPTSLIGIDLSEGMLKVAHNKFAHGKYSEIATFRQCDCTSMPFDSESFDAITVAFGVRNFEHLHECYKEMHRVLCKGGALCVIELSQPKSPFIKPFYKIYTCGIIPLAGRLISNDTRAYSYLPESIAAVPQGNDMTHIMESAGFENATFHTLTFGVCTIYMATK